MAALKRLVLLLTLGALAALGMVLVRADHVPVPPLPDLLETHWGRKEPLKTHTLKRVEDIDTQLQGNGG